MCAQDAGRHEVSNRRTVVPITISSPSASFRSRIVAPLTRVPLVELRSTTTTSLPDPPDLGMSAAGIGIGDHHGALGKPPDGDRLGSEDHPVPVGQHDRGRRQARWALLDLGDDGEPTPALAGILDDGHGHRPDEDVLLGPGVLPGRLLELPDQGVQEALEPIEVTGGEVDDEGIGRDEAMDPHPALEVHLPGQPTTDLHRVELAPEGLGEGAVDHALEAPFELLESHAGVSLPVSTPW